MQADHWLLDAIPASVRDVPGAAFYSGAEAYAAPTPLYVLGLNPGGGDEGAQTVLEATQDMVARQEYNAFRHGTWQPNGRPTKMQKSVMHVLDGLRDAGLAPDATAVPCSNVVFRHTPRSHDLTDKAQAMAECWPVHAELIERLQVRVVLCIGGEAAGFVRNQVGAHTLEATFVEGHGLRNKSHIYTGPDVTVVHAVHTTVSAWYTAPCDITPLVARALTLSSAR